MKKQNFTQFVTVTSSLCFFGLLAIAPGAKAGMVTYSMNGQSYEGYFAKKSASAPLVILIHDWDGLTGYEIKRAEMLKKRGYSVFALDLFGKGVRPTEDKDKKQHTGELYKDRKKMRAVIQAGIDTAKKNGLNTANAVIAGYCFGGAAVLEYARSGANLKGFATFHGGLATPEGQDYSKTKGKVIIFHGSADSSIKMNDFAKLTNELEASGVSHEMITYSGAPHAFTVFGSDRYRADADKKSWARFLEFLKDATRK